MENKRIFTKCKIQCSISHNIPFSRLHPKFSYNEYEKDVELNQNNPYFVCPHCHHNLKIDIYNFSDDLPEIYKRNIQRVMLQKAKGVLLFSGVWVLGCLLAFYSASKMKENLSLETIVGAFIIFLILLSISIFLFHIAKKQQWKFYQKPNCFYLMLSPIYEKEGGVQESWIYTHKIEINDENKYLFWPSQMNPQKLNIEF